MLLEVPPSFKRPDGLWEHHIRQSDISRFRQCPELHRRKMLGKVSEQTNDAAAIGTACHAGVELALSSIVDGYEPNHTVCKSLACDTIKELWSRPDLHQVQIKHLTDAIYFTATAFDRWWNHFMDDLLQLDIVAVERRFDVVAFRDPWRIVYLAGTADVWTDANGVIDWKFPGDKYAGSNAWKHERYDNQPTHYLWAYVLEHLGTNPLLEPNSDKLLPDFSYGVTLREKDHAEELSISRTVGDVHFYRDELLSLCKLIEADLDRWPLGPMDWWCSDKWCPAWNECRGMHMPEDPFGLMAKVAEKLGKPSPRVHIETDDEAPEADAFAWLPEGNDPF